MERIPGIGKRDEGGGAWRWLLLLLAGAGVALWLKQRGAPMLGAGSGTAGSGVSTWQPTPPPDAAERPDQAAEASAMAAAAAAELPGDEDSPDDVAAAIPLVTSGEADPGEATPDGADAATEDELAERASDRGATLDEGDESASPMGIARPAEPEEEGAGGEADGGGDAGPVMVDETPGGFAALDERGYVDGDGSTDCPEGYPIKGNATSRIFHLPGESSYAATKAEICFATEEDAVTAGYRPRAR